MKLKLVFEGDLEELKLRLEECGVAGEWFDEANGVHRVKFADGTSLHWARAGGTLWCDGPNAAAKVLEHRVTMALHWMHFEDEDVC